MEKNINPEKTCLACGVKFRPSNFTRLNQDYCGSPECVKVRDKARKERWLASLDAEKDRERRRLASQYSMKSRRKRLEREISEAREAVKDEMRNGSRLSKSVMELIAGFAAHICGAKTGEELAVFFAKMKSKGRRLLPSCEEFK